MDLLNQCVRSDNELLARGHLRWGTALNTESVKALDGDPKPLLERSRQAGYRGAQTRRVYLKRH